MTVSEKINQLRDNAAVKGLTAPAQAAPKVAKTASVAVSGKAFKKKSKPKVTVTIKVSDGTVKGRVAIFVGGKKVKVFNAVKAKTTVTLPKKYSKNIKVKAKYAPTTAANGTTKTSSSKTIKVK